MAKDDIWTTKHVRSLAPDEASIPAAQKVLKKGGFGTVEATADGRGWWVVCQGITDMYQVSVRRNDDAFDCECTCPSPKYPCKHALALLFYLVEHPELRTEAEAPKAVASDFEGLLRAVFREPEEDTPRLVFADYLEENDQSPGSPGAGPGTDTDRAALIRLQCEYTRLKPQSKRARELMRLINPLIAKLQKEILPLPENVYHQFYRGFVRLVGQFDFLGDAGALPARLARLFREGWIEEINTAPYYFAADGETAGTLSLLTHVGELDVSGFFVTEDALIALVANTAEARATGRLARVKVHERNRKAFDRLVKAEHGEAVAPSGRLSLDRVHYALAPRAFELMMRTGRLSGARTLALGGRLGDAELAALLTADLSELQDLRLVGWTLTRDGLESFADSTDLSRLQRLELNACELGAGSTSALAAATGLGGLEWLGLLSCGLGDADAEALARSRAFPNLATISLRNNRDLTARGAAALLASKNYPKLTDVNLLDTGVEDESEQLAIALNAPDRESLTVRFLFLTVQRRTKGTDVIVDLTTSLRSSARLFDRFAGNATANRVTQFTATRAAIGVEAGPALAAGFDPAKLRRLDLTNNPLRNDGAAAIAAAFAFFKLHELKLCECRIQSAGVVALINSPLLATVRTLDLSRNNIGKAGVAALLKASAPALKSLVLTECRLTPDDKKQLAKKYGTKVKM